jgi:hypothetical protein
MFTITGETSQFDEKLEITDVIHEISQLIFLGRLSEPLMLLETAAVSIFFCSPSFNNMTLCTLCWSFLKINSSEFNKNS